MIYNLSTRSLSIVIWATFCAQLPLAHANDPKPVTFPSARNGCDAQENSLLRINCRVISDTCGTLLRPEEQKQCFANKYDIKVKKIGLGKAYDSCERENPSFTSQIDCYNKILVPRLWNINAKETIEVVKANGRRVSFHVRNFAQIVARRLAGELQTTDAEAICLSYPITSFGGGSVTEAPCFFSIYHGLKDKNPDKVKPYLASLQTGCKKGNENKCLAHAHLLHQDSPKKEHEILKSLCAKSSKPASQKSCLRLYDIAWIGTPPDVNKRSKDLERACNSGVAYACHQRAMFDEAAGKKTNLKVAFSKACKLGELAGCRALIKDGQWTQDNKVVSLIAESAGKHCHEGDWEMCQFMTEFVQQLSLPSTLSNRLNQQIPKPTLGDSDLKSQCQQQQYSACQKWLEETKGTPTYNDAVAMVSQHCRNGKADYCKISGDPTDVAGQSAEKECMACLNSQFACQGCDGFSRIEASRGNYVHAIDITDKSCRAGNSSSCDALLGAGEAMLTRDEKAVEILKSHCRGAGNSYGHCYILGKHLIKTDSEAAIHYFSEACSMNPAGEACRDLGKFLVSINQPQKAIEALKPGCSDHSCSHCEQLSDIYAGIGEKKQAAEALKPFLKMNPEHTPMLLKIGLRYKEAGDRPNAEINLSKACTGGEKLACEELGKLSAGKR